MLMSFRVAGSLSVRLSVSTTIRQYGLKRKGQGGVKGKCNSETLRYVTHLTFDRYAFIVVLLLFARSIGPTFVNAAAALPFLAASWSR